MTTQAPTGVGANFRTHPEAFDNIIISGVKSPGICVVQHTKKHEWDKKKSKGSSGGTISFTGNALVEFSVKYHLWEVDHFEAWPVFAAMQRQSIRVPAPTPGAATGNIRQASAGGPTLIIPQPATVQPVAMSVYYPTLDEIGVFSIIVEEEGGLEPDGKGGAYYTWKYAEYKPSIPSGGTVSTSQSGSPNGPGGAFQEPTAPTAGEQRLTDLLNRAAGLTR